MSTQPQSTVISCLDGIINRLGDGSRRKRSHSETKSVDEDLYRLLHPCLVEHKTNVAAFVMGSRGSGKSRLVENCLSRMDRSKFRTLRLNGLVVRGNDVAFAVNELVRQLSELAFLDTGQRDTALLRLKRTSFTSNLSLLDEVFKLAKVDERPILIILDEMDAFAGSSGHLDVNTNLVERTVDRQLLLYHILDRVASSDSSLCFIGITSHLAAVSLLEKRVRSRAEGTSKTIFVKPFNSYATLIQVLLPKFDGSQKLRSSMEEWLSLEKETTELEVKLLRQIFQRNYKIGKDLRWFTRVFSVALTLYRENVRVAPSSEDPIHSPPLEFEPKYLLESLAIMGASATGCDDASFITEPRIQVLKDLSGPQVALLLAARRLLARDAKIEDVPKPLTLDRMLHEYQSYKGNSNRYSGRLLLRSFTQMLEMDVFRPSSDHSGGGPLQYEYSGSFAEMDTTTLTKLPLHVPYGLEVELTRTLKDKLLDCSTALQDWGKKEN